jgi:hypothetical protein
MQTSKKGTREAKQTCRVVMQKETQKETLAMLGLEL